MQSKEAAFNLLWKEHDILVLGPENNSVPRERSKILGRGQGRRDSVTGDGDVCDVETIVEQGKSRVFDAKFLPQRSWLERSAILLVELQSVRTPQYFEVRDE